jgi:hypothetical protein
MATRLRNLRLVSIDTPAATRSGVVIGKDVLDFARAGEILPLAGWVPASMPVLLAADEEGLDMIRRIIDQVEDGRSDEVERLRERHALQPLAEVKLAPSVPCPGILLSHGRSYCSHVDEMLIKTDMGAEARKGTQSVFEEPVQQKRGG